MNSEWSDTDPHQHATEQIPWYVNGSLEASEVGRLAAHLDECARCRSDYEAQRRLFAAMQADSTLVFAAEPSFQKLMARIADDADASALLGRGPAAAVATVVPPRQRATRNVARWLAAAVVLEGLCLGYGAWVWHARSSTAGSYVTLASADPSYRDSPRIRIVFRPGLSMQGLATLLHGAGAHIIDGPTTANVYTLGFTGAEVTPHVVASRAATLRASTDVLFAEPQGVRDEGEGNQPR